MCPNLYHCLKEKKIKLVSQLKFFYVKIFYYENYIHYLLYN